MTYQSTKFYDHNVGLSCAFRQWRAESHCAKLHGYSLAVKFVFETEDLDAHNWCVDYGSLKPVKQMLQDTFDHKLLVAVDDPQFTEFLELQRLGVADVVIVKATGCEAFAKMIYEWVSVWLAKVGYAPRVRLISVEVREHSANSAVYLGEKKC